MRVEPSQELRHVAENSATRSGLRAAVCGACLGLPLNVQITPGRLAIAQGHAETRQLGVYLPLLVPLGIGLLWLWGSPRTSRRSGLVNWATLLHWSLSLALVIGYVVYRNNRLFSVALWFQTALLPLLIVAFARRQFAPAFLAGVVRSFCWAVLGTAAVAVTLVAWVPFDPQIGYVDDFGPVGIPSSLRIFPTTVVIASLLAHSLDSRLRWMRYVERLLPVAGGLLVLTSHSRTAVLMLIVGYVLVWMSSSRSAPLTAIAAVAIGAALLSQSISLPGASLTRLVEGSGASDDTRAERIVESFAIVAEHPFGLAFIPSAVSETSTGLRTERVLTAENQLGTYGGSAGLLALVASIGFAVCFLAIGRRLLANSGDYRLVGAATIIYVLGAAFQINFSNAYLAGVGLLLYLASVGLDSCAEDAAIPGRVSVGREGSG